MAPKGDNGEDDKTDSFSLKRSLKADKSNINPSEEMPIRMNYEMVYDEGKYALYNGNDRWWALGIADCTVSGNTCPGTRIEDREDYANIRYLVVDEEEKAEELTIEMTCGEWFYYVEDKTTNEIFPVSGGGGNPEILTVTVKIGGNSQDSQGSDSGSEPVKQGGSQQQGSQQQLPVEVRTDEVILANGEKIGFYGRRGLSDGKCFRCGHPDPEGTGGKRGWYRYCRQKYKVLYMRCPKYRRKKSVGASGSAKREECPHSNPCGHVCN